jgi:DNA topoisomerase I
MNVVIVESPAKAKTINKYLGKDYHVLASFGHVRDLPAKNGSVRPDDDFAMVWEVDGAAHKRIAEIVRAVKGADKLFLATDPDREGEAISWHVRDILAERKALNKVAVSRVVFNEITKTAIQEAFKHPRELNQELIEAYLARRALDYLVGFTLSPVLWRKLPGSRSAGRVQSVALRLVCDREQEIEAFITQEYWTIDGLFAKTDAAELTARLKVLASTKLEKFTLGTAGSADTAVQQLAGHSWRVASIDNRTVRRHPAPPFITSTLQQEAARKLGFSASQTMRIAQQLYEGVDIGGETTGLITYMRTDGVQLAGEAIAACRQVIAQKYGQDYLPESPRVYKSKAKNAQEAHEASRPTSLQRLPDHVAGTLSREQLALYTLIWKRTLACQMASAVLDQVAADITAATAAHVFQANGSVIRFDGFLTLYREDRDDEDDEENRRLPALTEGESLDLRTLTPHQHFTQPPPRYTEASLVKKMEELGIGRPSTYASVLQVLKDRQYVRLDNKRFFPEERGRLVTAFLTSYFNRYVEYDFTANLEEQLDEVSAGSRNWKAVLRQFWDSFYKAVQDTEGLKISDVLDVLDQQLAPLLFPPAPEGSTTDPRLCPACQTGRLGLKLSRYGAFVGCNRYPDCGFTRPFGSGGQSSEGATGEDGTALQPLSGETRTIGRHPDNGHEITLRKGPYGWYVQEEGAFATDASAAPATTEAMGAETAAAAVAVTEEDAASTSGGKTKKAAATAKTKALAKPKAPAKAKTKAASKPPKPKRSSLPKGMNPATLTLEQALSLLSLPRAIGAWPESGENIYGGIGPYGPYLRLGKVFVSVPKDDDVLTLGLNRAISIMADGLEKAKDKVRELGLHPTTGKEVTLKKSRFGWSVLSGKSKANLPRGSKAEAMTLDEAVALLAAGKAGG